MIKCIYNKGSREAMLLVINTNSGGRKEENGGKNEKSCKIYNGNFYGSWVNWVC